MAVVWNSLIASKEAMRMISELESAFDLEPSIKRHRFPRSPARITAVVGVIFVTWSVFKVSMPYPIREEALRRSNKLLKRAIALYASLPKPPLPPLLPSSPPLWKQTNLSHLSLLHLPGNA